MKNEKNENEEESEENEENEESDDNDDLKEKTNMTNIIINNTNKMNINNININNRFFINLLPQNVITETYKGKIKEKENFCIIYNEQEKYIIKKGNNSIFNGEVIKYITKLCIKSVDYYSNLNSNEIDIKKITTKNIIKYLNILIKAEWFVLICDINEENNFEFSYSELNEEDIIVFQYKKYKIYIYLLFLKLNTDFDFETPIPINKEEKIEEKVEEKNIIKCEDNSNEKNEIVDKTHIDKEINTNENDESSQENNIKIKEKDIIINENDNLIQNNDIKNLDKDNEEKKLLNENINVIKNEDEENQENKSLIKEDIKEETNNEELKNEKYIKKENIKEEDNIKEIKIEKDIEIESIKEDNNIQEIKVEKEVKIENLKEKENTEEPKIEIDIKTENIKEESNTEEAKIEKVIKIQNNDEGSELKNELKEEKPNEKVPIIENEVKEEKNEDKLSLEKDDKEEQIMENPSIEKDTQKNNLIQKDHNNKEPNFSIINIIKKKIEEIRKEKLEEPKENKDIINNDEIKNENIIIDIGNNNENKEKNNIENIFKKDKEIIIDDSNEEKAYKYDVNTYNYRFTKRRQYYKNKNKLKVDNIYDTHKLERNEKYQHKRINTMENNILSIYNMSNEDDQTSNKPIDLIEPNNLYYLRQDIRINNTTSNIESNKQLYSNIQKRIKRMLINTKIPIFNFDNYKIIKTIGEGTYGQLYSVTNILTKKSYAMKELIATDINYFYQCLTTLGINYYNKHSNILDIYGIYVIIFAEKNFFIYALMDLAEGDWEKEIRRRKELYKYYKEDELILILKQLVSALAFLQKRNIAHRDIKLENILLFPNNIKDENDLGLDKIYKIGDFGEAKNKIKYSVILNTIRGTDYYMSPELLEGVNKQKDFIKNNPHKSDVFSLGCCMMIASTLNYEIIHSIRNPKTQDELNKVIKTVLEKRYSEKFSYLIIKMLINDENKRIDFINLERLIKRKYL